MKTGESPPLPNIAQPDYECSVASVDRNPLLDQSNTAGQTHVGRVRSENQDRFLVRPGLLVIADGMGGHAGGGDAASTVIDAFTSLADEANSPVDLVGAIEAAHRAVAIEAELTGRPEMGATVTAVAIDRADGLFVVHAGDSPAWLWSGATLSRLTRDHVTKVMTTRSDGTQVLRSALTRCVGGKRERVDPDVAQFPAAAGAWVIVASDGLTKELSDQAIAEIVRTSRSPGECCGSLCEAAVSGGGRDNITVVVGIVSGPLG